MSDDALSKRARQKQRRDAKLEEQRRQQKAARRSRILLLSLVSLLVLALVGLGIYRWQAGIAAEEAKAAAVKARLAEIGCTEDTPQTDLGGGHIASAEELQNSPPDVLYPERPTASGKHHGNWAKSAFYDVKVDERILVHNLEHGYVNVWYDDGLAADQLAKLETFVTESIDGKYPKLIAAPFDGDLPDDNNVAFTAWTFKQSCELFDQDTLEVFLNAHYSGNGVAPEKNLPPALTAGNGTLDPEGEDLLLPPLGDAQPTEGISEPAGSESAAEPTEEAS